MILRCVHVRSKVPSAQMENRETGLWTDRQNLWGVYCSSNILGGEIFTPLAGTSISPECSVIDLSYCCQIREKEIPLSSWESRGTICCCYVSHQLGCFFNGAQQLNPINFTQFPLFLTADTSTFYSSALQLHHQNSSWQCDFFEMVLYKASSFLPENIAFNERLKISCRRDFTEQKG